MIFAQNKGCNKDYYFCCNLGFERGRVGLIRRIPSKSLRKLGLNFFLFGSRATVPVQCNYRLGLWLWVDKATEVGLFVESPYTTTAENLGHCVQLFTASATKSAEPDQEKDKSAEPQFYGPNDY